MQLLGFCLVEEVSSLFEGTAQAGAAQVVGSAFQQSRPELHPQCLGYGGDILVEKLLLQVDGVGGDDGLAVVLQRMAYGRYEVGQRFADAGSCLGQQSRAILQRGCHGSGHELLLGAVLESPPAGQDAAG